MCRAAILEGKGLIVLFVLTVSIVIVSMEFNDCINVLYFSVLQNAQYMLTDSVIVSSF